MKKIGFFELLTFCIFLNAFPSEANSSSVINNLLVDAKRSLTKPGEIPAVSQKIQDFFSNPSNKNLINTPEAHELAQIQNRLINYTRLAKDLTRSSCNLDSTRKSAHGEEILRNSLTAPVCNEVSPEYLQDFKKVETLLKEVEMVETHSYTGTYAINEAGDMVFPWEVAEKEKANLKWKLSLNEVKVSDKPSGKEVESDSVFDPLSDSSINQFKDELYRQSLKDTFSTYIYLHTNYGNEKVRPEQLVKDFCHEKRTFWSRIKGKRQFGKCPKSIEKFILKMAKEKVQNKAESSFETATNQLNEDIKKLNSVISRIQKNTTVKYHHNGKTEQKSVTDAFFTDTNQAKKDLAEYKKLHNKISHSGHGLFIATDELFGRLGPKKGDPLSFQTPHPLISSAQFKKAVKEAQEHTFNHAQELLSIYDSKISGVDKLKEFLKLNPSAASTVLINNPQYGGTACRGLHGISVNEMNDNQLRMLSTWGGAIVGGAVAFTGVGAIPVALIGAAAAAPDMAMSYKHFEEASNLRDSGFAQRDGSKSLKLSETYETAKNEALTAGAFMGAGILADVYFGLKAGKAINSAIDASKSAGGVAQTSKHLGDVGPANKALAVFQKNGLSENEATLLYKKFEDSFSNVRSRSPASQDETSELLAIYINKQTKAGKSPEDIKKRLALALKCK